jgi:hypothetical protein
LIRGAVLPGKSKGSRLAFPRTAKVGADSWLRWRSRLPVRYRIRSLETVGGAYNCGAWYAARNNTDPLLFVLSTNRSRISLCPSAASRRSRLGHFLGCCWFWRSDHGGPKLGTHSALKSAPGSRIARALSHRELCAPIQNILQPISDSEQPSPSRSSLAWGHQIIGVPKDTDMISKRFRPKWGINRRSF